MAAVFCGMTYYPLPLLLDGMQQATGSSFSAIRADLRGTTLSHVISLQQVYDMNRFV